MSQEMYGELGIAEEREFSLNVLYEGEFETSAVTHLYGPKSGAVPDTTTPVDPNAVVNPPFRHVVHINSPELRELKGRGLDSIGEAFSLLKKTYVNIFKAVLGDYNPAQTCGPKGKKNELLERTQNGGVVDHYITAGDLHTFKAPFKVDMGRAHILRLAPVAGGEFAGKYSGHTMGFLTPMALQSALDEPV